MTYLISSDTYPLCYEEIFIELDGNTKKYIKAMNMKISLLRYQFNVIDYIFYSHKGATSRFMYL